MRLLRFARNDITMTDTKRSFWAGVRSEIPLLIGVFPFGLIYGALAINSGLPPLTAQLMS
jgi:predicted branched-subunit amino acid permease